MVFKGIGATTEIDRHNCKITKEALESACESINKSDYAPAVGIEHDRTIMPIGKVVKGEIVKLENDEFALEIHQELFDKFKIINNSNNNEKFFEAESIIDSRPFADTQNEKIETLTIGMDPVNFSDEDYETLLSIAQNECGAENDVFCRKAFVPDLEIVFKLVTGTLAVMTGKKTLDKLADKISDDLSNVYARLKKFVLAAVKYCKPQNRPVTYVISENQEHLIELIIRTSSPNDVFNALTAEKINVLMQNMTEIKSIFEDIAKIQFLYNIEENKWEFNYLTTVTGKVIGTEKCYKRTVQLSQNIIKNSNKTTPVSIQITDSEKEG